MTWFVFSILTAFCESIKDIFSKKSFEKIDEYIIAWSIHSFAAIFLIPILYFTDIPTLGNKFWFAFFIRGTLNVVTTILYMKAIKSSELSITVPMVTLTPFFLLITSPLIVGEFPTLYGVVGILLIVTGSYILNIDEKKKAYFEPFRALLRDKGPRLMLIVAFIWSITSNFDKIGVQNSTPLVWAILQTIFLSLVMFPIILYKSRENLRHIPKNIRFLLPIGFFNALTIIFQMTAINLTLVAYVISIKRMSAVITVVLGYLIFKERSIKERLIGTFIMFLGVVLITLFE